MIGGLVKSPAAALQLRKGFRGLGAGDGPEEAQSGLLGDNGYFRGGFNTDGLWGRGWDRLPDQWNFDWLHAELLES
jgi:hypothetical protein